MPKSFLFSHKRYDLESQDQFIMNFDTSSSPISQPPPLLRRLPDVNVVVINPPAGSSFTSFSSLSSSAPPPPRHNHGKIKGFEKITKRYAERYRAEAEEMEKKKNNIRNSAYCIKIPVPVPPLISISSPSPIVNTFPPNDKDKFRNWFHPQGKMRNSYGFDNHDHDQPVNLSVKKVDLFNLNCLAEVSLATAEAQGMLISQSDKSPSSSCKSVSSSSSWSSSSSSSSSSRRYNRVDDVHPQSHDHGPLSSSQSDVNKSMKKSGELEETLCVTIDDDDDDSCISVRDYEMGELRICESPTTTTTSSTSVSATSDIPPPDDDDELHSFPSKTASTSGLSSRKTKKMKNIMKASSFVSHVQSQSQSNENEEDLNLNPSLSSPSSLVSLGSISSTTSIKDIARHKCLECGKGFSTLSNLARHRQTHRSLSDTSAVKKCPHCDKVYVSMPAFSMHLRTHNQGCKCPYCGKGFSRPWLLQGHIRTHTGEKPFKCSICEKAFADKSNLRAHTQTHSSDKPFVCSRCCKPFALKSYLCKHIESSCMKTSRTSPSSKEKDAKGVGVGGDNSSCCSSFSNNSADVEADEDYLNEDS